MSREIKFRAWDIIFEKMFYPNSEEEYVTLDCENNDLEISFKNINELINGNDRSIFI